MQDLRMEEDIAVKADNLALIQFSTGMKGEEPVGWGHSGFVM